jgi:hypothetical protein
VAKIAVTPAVPALTGGRHLKRAETRLWARNKAFGVFSRAIENPACAVQPAAHAEMWGERNGLALQSAIAPQIALRPQRHRLSCNPNRISGFFVTTL